MYTYKLSYFCFGDEIVFCFLTFPALFDANAIKMTEFKAPID